MNNKEIKEIGKQEYAKWRANQNKLNLLKRIADESSNDRLQKLPVHYVAAP